MDYDTYLFNLAEAYYKECKPTALEPETKYHSGLINCQVCDNIDCIYYKEYNDE